MRASLSVGKSVYNFDTVYFTPCCVSLWKLFVIKWHVPHNKQLFIILFSYRLTVFIMQWQIQEQWQVAYVIPISCLSSLMTPQTNTQLLFCILKTKTLVLLCAVRNDMCPFFMQVNHPSCHHVLCNSPMTPTSLMWVDWLLTSLKERGGQPLRSRNCHGPSMLPLHGSATAGTFLLQIYICQLFELQLWSCQRKLIT